MLLCAVGGARGVPELAAAGLLHDLGMRHLPARLLRQRERLGREDAAHVAAHPLVGAYQLASVLGAHPAVAAAQCHHWRCGQGYPALARAPSRSIEVVSVASAFAALTQTRPFRQHAYDARGASDVLAAEAMAGHADANTVKLLVHALRGGRGDPRTVRFGRERAGHGPDASRYVHVSAPARSPV
jgi:HD-GYP domain-containing protein (c-di-GMP phosphodiesterase class II)